MIKDLKISGIPQCPGEPDAIPRVLIREKHGFRVKEWEI
jgi:hypothetical protein